MNRESSVSHGVRFRKKKMDAPLRSRLLVFLPTFVSRLYGTVRKCVHHIDENQCPKQRASNQPVTTARCALDHATKRL